MQRRIGALNVSEEAEGAARPRVGRRTSAIRGVTIGCLISSGLGLLAGIAGAAEVESALMQRAGEGDTVRVLVELDLPETVASAAVDPVGRAAAIRGAKDAMASDLAGTSWVARRTFTSIPYTALTVSADALQSLARSPMVRRVIEDRVERPHLPDSVPQIGADIARINGFDGAGWAVAVIDTGVDSSHPMLAGRVVREACFSGNASCPNGQTQQIGSGAGAPCTFADNACGHGTHVAGIVAGDARGIIGVAPGADVIAIQAFSRFTGGACEDDMEDPCALTLTSDTVAGLEYVFSLRSELQIAAVNLSLGGGSFTSEADCDAADGPRKAVIDNLREVGIATVVSAGNESSPNALSAPACVSSAISVGATTPDDGVPMFSNSAPFLDLLAPGAPILSSFPGENLAVIGGTSQASPHVAGAFAVLNQKRGLPDVEDTVRILKETGAPVFDPKSGRATPRIDVSQALDVVPGSGPASGVQVSPDGQYVLVSKDVAGQRWAITLNPDRSVTGNVFRPEGGEPAFVWCEDQGRDGNPDPDEEIYRFQCFAAGPCRDGDCPEGEWDLAGAVSLPGSFFLAPDIGRGAAAPRSTLGRVAQDLPTGVQITPDSARTLVSKDIAGMRWAITQHADDGIVTGNVFGIDGSPPSFVWCQPTGDDGNPDQGARLTSYSCFGATRCFARPCDASAWSFIAAVELPGSFFLP